MNCRDVQPLLARYVDDEVDHYERTLIEQHLAECQNCSFEVSQLRVARHRVQREIKSWAASTFPPPSAWERLIARLAAEKENPALSTTSITPSNNTLLSRFKGATSGGRHLVVAGLVGAVVAAALILTLRTTPVPRNTSVHKDTVLIDDFNSDYFDRLPEPITRAELVKRFTTAYLLKRLPDGFRLKIVAPPKPTPNHDFFRIDYRNTANVYFLIQSLDTAANHGDLKVETYRTNNGLSIHIMEDRNNVKTVDQTNAIVDLPGGGHVLVSSNLPRAEIKTWVENLVPARS